MKQILINLFTFTLLSAILLFMTVITERTIPGASKYMLIMITAAAVCDSVKGERT
jgi:flagellar biosynthesis protein FliR